MNRRLSTHASVSDSELLTEVRRLASCEREAMVRLIAALGELDARRLYLGEGCSSLFTYCTHVLHLSEHAAYARIEAARAARRWPILLELLEDGALHLTAVTLLSRHLTDDNHRKLFAAARHKTKREIEEIVAALRPQPVLASTVRRLPEAKPPSREVEALPTTGVDSASGPGSTAVPESRERELASENREAEVKALAPERYKLQCTVSRGTYDKLREAQDLLRHRIPNGDIALILDRALTLLLAEVHKTKHAAVDRPSHRQPSIAHSRHIPAGVKRAVWERDEGRCAFVGVAGRCTERGFLEYHHVVPFADGGMTTVDNLALRCRAHNAHEAHLWSGIAEAEVFGGTSDN